MKQMIISHPEPGDSLNQRFLAAQGYFERHPPFLIGIVKQGNKRIAAGTMLIPPPYWLITFDNLPAGNGYILEIHNGDALADDAHSGEILAQVRFSILARDDRESPPDLVAGPTIWYPAPGATIGQNFYAYGTTSSQNALTGTINGVTGTQTQGPPATANWILSFTGVGRGTGLTLMVNDGSQTSESVSVQ
jgi:hypothetical protein